jgi:hypothetical protein
MFTQAPGLLGLTAFDLAEAPVVPPASRRLGDEAAASAAATTGEEAWTPAATVRAEVFARLAGPAAPPGPGDGEEGDDFSPQAAQDPVDLTRC